MYAIYGAFKMHNKIYLKNTCSASFKMYFVKEPYNMRWQPGVYNDWIRILSGYVQNRHRARGPVNLRYRSNRG